jgi:hypothetical protein
MFKIEDKIFYLYKIIDVCPQGFDSVIHDWLKPPSLESPKSKRAKM